MEHVRDAPQQANSFDCGMYTVLVAEGLASKTAVAPIPAEVAQDEVTASSSPEGMAVAPRLCESSGPRQVKEAELPAGDAIAADSSSGRGGGRQGVMVAAKRGRSGDVADAGGMVMISAEFVANARILARERLSNCIRSQGRC